jgi:hypothetical protein
VADLYEVHLSFEARQLIVDLSPSAHEWLVALGEDIGRDLVFDVEPVDPIHLGLNPLPLPGERL